MKSSRISRSRIGLGGLAQFAAILLVTPVFAADTGAPVSLSPPSKGAPQTPPQALPQTAPATPTQNPAPPNAAPPSLPSSGQPAAKTAAPSAPAPSAYVPPKKLEPAIEVNPLQAVDPDSAGVLDADKGGFGIDMWAGTSRALVQRLLPQLPAKAPSHVMHDLMRRLLLSIAKAPEGEGGPNLISLRIERLAAMGDSDGVDQLLKNARQQNDEALARTRVDGQFLTDDTKSACDSVGQLIAKYTDSYWQKAFAYCQALGGDKEKARLSVSLLREGEGDKDPAFFTLADFVINGVPTKEPVKESTKDKKNKKDAKPAPEPVPVKITGPLSPLELAMLRTAKQPFPPDAAAGADPSVLRAVASNTGADIDARLSAAERAEAAGALPASDLANIYVDVPFKPDELSNALTSADQIGGARGRALLYQAALKQNVPAARGEALEAAWKLARKDGFFATLARVTAPLAVDIAPASELMSIAADAGSVLFLADKREQAIGWYRLAADSSEADARKTVAALWPLAVLSDAEKPKSLDSEAVHKWLDAEKQNGGDNWQDRAARVLGLFEALEIPVDPGFWDSLVRAEHAPAQMPGIALWTLLDEAGDKNRTGAAVLLGMLAVGDDGPVAASPVTLQAAVGSLSQVGLDADARKLAIEALAAQ